MRAAVATTSEKAGPLPASPAASGRPGPPPPSKRNDLAPIEEALRLLGKAVQKFHTYPATSPMCVDAVMACYDALKLVPHRDRLTSRVTPRDLIVDEISIGSGTVIEHELTRRLFKLRVAQVDIDRDTTPRHLTRFCVDLVEAEDKDDDMTFAERLAEHGVDSIIVEMMHRPAVLDVGVAPPTTRDLLEREKRRREELTQPDAPVSYLYPPDKGWVRMDPAQQHMDAVSLVDLVVLVNDPADVATMLLRLTGDDLSGPDVKDRALERKYSDITMLCSALDPRLAQVMFGKLAKAVLKLEPERRNNLLQRTILPGLLDGRADGQVLRDFPDVDLAESICLLLDLETAAPEVLSAALNRLDLAPERRAALEPLIDERQRARASGETETRDVNSMGASTIEKHARELIRVDGSRGSNFSEFAAFDLSIDEHATEMIGQVCEGIGTTDPLTAQLGCITHLIRIEPNSTLVEAFLKRAHELMAMLERASRWSDVIATVETFKRLSTELAERRPDVSETITRSLGDYCTPNRLLSLAELHERDAEGRTIVHDVARALGAALVPGFIALADHTSQQDKARALTTLMCELAPTVAPALVIDLESRSVTAARVIAKVLGHAGAGFETPLARLVDHHDQQVSREALRSLAHIGTAAAAAPIARQIRKSGNDKHAAAEDALWHFPPHQTMALLKDLVGSRDFVMNHPQTAARLIERAGQGRLQGLEDILKPLESLRYRFWKPSLVHVARKAKEYRAR